MRSIALDVHRDCCEVAIKEGGELRSARRPSQNEYFEMSVDGLS